MLKTVRDIFLFVWQLPQNLLGLGFILILHPKVSLAFGHFKAYFSPKMKGGISLGRYVIIESGKGTTNTILHESGHCRQSLFLGPLYLFIIGLPSLLWAAWWNPKRPRSYYWFYTERWADKLGGVER